MIVSKKAYFRAKIELQNIHWKWEFDRVLKLAFDWTKNDIQTKKLSKCIALAGARIWMYLASEDFANGIEFDGLIDNIQASDMGCIVDDYFDFHKIKIISERHKMLLGFYMYKSLFEVSDIEEYKESVGYEE